ncbi:MAG: histidine phosphatase family protein [Patescibacteria group bacterium]|nr:histidine phosphatase family protein [Patescibacteria group bacterium]
MDKIARQPNQDPSLHVDLFRHGSAKYEQGKTTVEEAADLTEAGIAEVKTSAEALAELISPDEEVQIWSSPMGRTLQTAKIISETLAAKGVNLRGERQAEGAGIKVFDQLSEVKNFSWSLFSPLVYGGEVEYAGRKFVIDAAKTNPQNLGPAQYYASDNIHNISAEAKAGWPAEYVKAVEDFEDFMSVTKRIMKPLVRLKGLSDKPYRVIIVTHDALLGFVANIFSGGESAGVNPAEFINLERKDGQLVATKVGQLDRPESKDVIDEFNQQHQ